jgi:hypothetical protein
MSLWNKHESSRRTHPPAGRHPDRGFDRRLVEIVPLFYLEDTIEKVEGMRPYTPLELAGRNIYVREGCYTCHSQMIRRCATRSSATATTQPGGREHVRPPRSSGARSAPGPTWPASAASIPTTGTWRT